MMLGLRKLLLVQAGYPPSGTKHAQGTLTIVISPRGDVLAKQGMRGDVLAKQGMGRSLCTRSLVCRELTGRVNVVIVTS